MEAERSSRSSVKRKPLSDRTNLIPTTTTTTLLRNLSSSSSSLFVKPPNPNLNPIPIPKPKPCNSYANKPDTNSSKSNTSVGSSNNNKKNAPNPRTTQPHPSTPPRVPPPHSSSINPGSGNNEIFEPIVIYSRRQTEEKTKYKGKAIAVPFSCPPPEKTKDKGKAVAVPFSCPPLEKTKDKGEAVSVPFSCPPFEKTKDKGKAVAVPFGCPPLENSKNKGKAVAVPISCPPLRRTRNIRNELKEAGDFGLSKSGTVPHPKHKKKRRFLLPEQDVSGHALPQDFIEQQRAYFEEVDKFELPEEEVSYNELDK